MQLFRRRGGVMGAGQGSTGNVICAFASLLYPGLGQLLQGRLLAATFFFLVATILWTVMLGWVIHLIATLDAAQFRPRWS